jgi:hypothetical protein
MPPPRSSKRSSRAEGTMRGLRRRERRLGPSDAARRGMDERGGRESGTDEEEDAGVAALAGGALARPVLSGGCCAAPAADDEDAGGGEPMGPSPFPPLLAAGVLSSATLRRSAAADSLLSDPCLRRGAASSFAPAVAPCLADGDEALPAADEDVRAVPVGPDRALPSATGDCIGTAVAPSASRARDLSPEALAALSAASSSLVAQVQVQILSSTLRCWCRTHSLFSSTFY